jgi:multiple sugar transport system permease protein
MRAMTRKPRTALDPSPLFKVIAYLLLGLWAFVVLFPLYWLVVTSFKTPIQVDSGPVYLPFVDFQPTLDAWKYIFVDLRNDTLRPYINTVVVGLISSVLALALGSTAAYALVRFQYGPRLGAIGLFIGTVALVTLAVILGTPWQLAVVSGVIIFFLLLQTIGRRFKRALGNHDIAFWLISQRMLPPVAVVIPIYVLFQQFGLLDTQVALIVTYVATNLPIVVWLMRDYFQTVPLELEECAAIDGASSYRIFWSIVVPVSIPGLVATFLFVLVFAWNEYLLALFLSGARAQTMPLTVAAQNATRGPQWWYMSVLILIMIIPVIAMAIALERFISRGLLVGAVKG